MFFTLFGTHTRVYGSSIAYNFHHVFHYLHSIDKKRGSLKLILASVGLAWHGWLFRDIHFRRPSELETKDLPKRPIAQAFTNRINIL